MKNLLFFFCIIVNLQLIVTAFGDGNFGEGCLGGECGAENSVGGTSVKNVLIDGSPGGRLTIKNSSTNNSFDNKTSYKDDLGNENSSVESESFKNKKYSKTFIIVFVIITLIFLDRIFKLNSKNKLRKIRKVK